MDAKYQSLIRILETTDKELADKLRNGEGKISDVVSIRYVAHDLDRIEPVHYYIYLDDLSILGDVAEEQKERILKALQTIHPTRVNDFEYSITDVSFSEKEAKTFNKEDHKKICKEVHTYFSQLAKVPPFFLQKEIDTKIIQYAGSIEAVYRNFLLAHLRTLYIDNGGLVQAESLQVGGKSDVAIHMPNGECIFLAEMKLRSGNTLMSCIEQLDIYCNEKIKNLAVIILEEGTDLQYSNGKDELSGFAADKGGIAHGADSNSFFINGINLLRSDDPVERNLFISIFHTRRGTNPA
ncbi:hypothetical protein [Bernardetia sp. MNP-M8]|uniref:hypothetical protein n=1 Tax=Bernardetia sp. MNP-M8 TaxID=3127470 RepID=UPI0030CE6CCF